LIGPGGKKPCATVDTVTVNGTEEAPVTLIDDAEDVQVASVGAPVQDTFTEPVKPLSGFTWRL
jgi:hypothetical protein